MSGWPSSLAEIPEMRAAGGPFSFDPEAPNVQAQLAAVEGFVTRAGYQPVETPEELTSGRTSYVAPVQDQDQWSIQAVTSDGFLVPVDGDGAIMDRPDWATGSVDHYQELNDGLGEGYERRFELVNGHWVPVVRNSEGRRVAFYDLTASQWRIELWASPPTVDHGLGSRYEATWDAEQGAWVAQSSDGTVAARWNPETNTWERILGGSFVSVTSMDDFEESYGMYQEVQPYLVPTPPEQWDSLRTLTLDDGTPMPWGVLTGMPWNDQGAMLYATPGLVRAVVPLYESHGGSIYAVVIEFPIPGGSPFYVYHEYTHTNPSRRVWIYPAEGYPIERIGRSLTFEESQRGFEADVLSSNQSVRLLQENVGKQLVFLVPTFDYIGALGEAIVNGQPFPPNVIADYLIIYQQAER
jgi:hypothetical protein